MKGLDTKMETVNMIQGLTAELTEVMKGEISMVKKKRSQVEHFNPEYN